MDIRNQRLTIEFNMVMDSKLLITIICILYHNDIEKGYGA